MQTTATNHYRDLVHLGTPIVVGQVGNLVLNFADTFMIGHHSTLELAAASFVNNIFVLAVLFAIGFNFAITPIVGPIIGRNERQQAGVALKAGFYANAVLIVLLAVCSIAFYLMLPHFGQPEELLPLMRPYLLVNILSLPFTVIGCQMKQFYDTIGKTSISMYVLISGNLLNVAGNWALIYGNCGMPELGLLGAGIATAVSRMLIAAAFCCLLLTKREFCIFKIGIAEARRDDVNGYFKSLHRLGWSSALQSTVECGAFSLVAIFVGWTGTKPLAAHQIMITMSMFFYNLYLGIATAISIRVSHYVGTGDTDEIVRVTRSGFFIIIAMAATVAVPVFCFRHDIGFLFTADRTVCRLVAATIIPLILYQISDAFQCCLANALRGLGEMRLMMYAAVFAYFIVSLPLSWWLGIVMKYGIVGIWSAFPVCLTVAGLLYWLIFRKRLSVHGGMPGQ